MESQALILHLQPALAPASHSAGQGLRGSVLLDIQRHLGARRTREHTGNAANGRGLGHQVGMSSNQQILRRSRGRQEALSGSHLPGLSSAPSTLDGTCSFQIWAAAKTAPKNTFPHALQGTLLLGGYSFFVCLH